MNPHLTGPAAMIYYRDLLREADHERLAAAVRSPRKPGPWRRRMGTALVRLGRHLSGDPTPTTAAARPQARTA